MSKQPRKNRAEDYYSYFGDMDLSEDEKEQRIKLAEELDDVFFFLFALILLQKDTREDFDESMLTESTILRYKDALVRFGYDLNKANDYLNSYVEENVPSIVDTTIRNSSDPYYMSEDRAKWIAENESNAVRNFSNYHQALKDGYKYKMWVTKRDRSVRHTHELVDNEKIGIKDQFEVGDCMMLYPKDVLNGTAEETVNCRCVLKFLEKDTSEAEDVEEKTSTIDELHIGTTDDKLHIGTVDDMLHVGTTDDPYLHIKVVDDVLRIVRKANTIKKQEEYISEEMQKNILVDDIKNGFFALLSEYSPEEIKSIFEERKYSITEFSDGSYIIELDENKTFEYHADKKEPYYVYETYSDIVFLNMNGKRIGSR